MAGNILILIITFALLIASIVQALQGDFLPAIYLALLWMGIKGLEEDD